MTEEYKVEFQNFFREMKKEEKELIKKKEYQITLKNTIVHISEVIRNQATTEQLNQYRNIDLRVQNSISMIENSITNIMSAERMLNNIQDIIEESLNTNDDFSYTKVAFLQNEITEYMKKRNEVEQSLDSTKIRFLLKELNHISDEISISKDKSNTSISEIEVNIGVPTQEELLNNIRQTMQNSSNTSETTNINAKDENNSENGDVERKVINVTEEQRKENTNVLIISEREQKVYLPYFQSDIDYLITNKKFSSKEEIINELYTLPLSRYSNFTMARIAEGFKLMREREKAPFVESLKYAFNLAFERNLHPAIITACRTVDDLDIYLACLEDNVLSLFDAFEIKFEYRPIRRRQSDKLQYFEGV